MRQIDKYHIEMKNLINKSQCGVIKSELNSFFDEEKDFITSANKAKQLSFYFLISNLVEIEIGYINWNYCVYLHNLNMYKEIMKRDIIPISLKGFYLKEYDNYKNKKRITGLYSYQEYINKFYLKIYKDYSDQYTNVEEIKKYEKFLVDQYQEKYEEKSNYSNLAPSLLSFPPNKEYKNLIKIYCNNISRNYFLDTDSEFIKKIIITYLYEYGIKQAHPKVYRLTGYYFVKSVKEYDYKIESLLDMDNRFLKYQIEYFNNIPKEIKDDFTKGNQNIFINQLVIIYRKIMDKLETESNYMSLSKEYRHTLRIKYGTSVLIDKYIPIYYNPFERPPDYGKIAIIANEYTSIGANANVSDATLLELNDISKDAKKDILDYIWYGNGSINLRIKYIYIIKDFYQFMEKNTKDKGTSNITKKMLITENTLYKYRKKQEFKIDNTSTLKSYLKSIRSLLKHHQNEYSITESMMKILNLNNLEKTNGGNPITESDLKIIYEEVKRKSQKNKLFLIVFELFTLTNLRLGEILNLERDCIKYKNASGKANISYLSKSSNREYISQLMSEKVTFIIENAIKETNSITNINKKLSKYIFIEKVEGQSRNDVKKYKFQYDFNNVLNELNDKLEIKNYTVNNLRHTYIHNVYKEGLKLNYSLPKIAAITNNSYKTATNYYRKYNEVSLYVETLSGVILSDVDINGEIINDNKYENNKNVKQDLGNCTENSCVFEAMECLICPHFVTFTNRIPKFESKLQEINKMIEDTDNPIIIEEAISQKKLLSKYLHNMIEIEENTNIDIKSKYK